MVDYMLRQKPSANPEEPPGEAEALVSLIAQ